VSGGSEFGQPSGSAGRSGDRSGARDVLGGVHVLVHVVLVVDVHEVVVVRNFGAVRGVEVEALGEVEVQRRRLLRRSRRRRTRRVKGGRPRRDLRESGRDGSGRGREREARRSGRYWKREARRSPAGRARVRVAGCGGFGAVQDGVALEEGDALNVGPDLRDLEGAAGLEDGRGRKRAVRAGAAAALDAVAAVTTLT
jgi:hypothetical protein